MSLPDPEEMIAVNAAFKKAFERVAFVRGLMMAVWFGGSIGSGTWLCVRDLSSRMLLLWMVSSFVAYVLLTKVVPNAVSHREYKKISDRFPRFDKAIRKEDGVR